MITSMALKIAPLDPDNVWSVANGRIKLVDLTVDKLTDFETYKKEAEALHGSAEDPYRNGATADKVIYAYRFTDIDPASWSPQWVSPSDSENGASAYRRLGMASIQERMNALLSRDSQSGSDEAKWSSRVFHAWLKEQFEALSTGQTQGESV